MVEGTMLIAGLSRTAPLVEMFTVPMDAGVALAKPSSV
jgi:hypothetical protein